LSGDLADFGGRMIQGVVLAHEEFVKANGKKVLLQIIDDQADPVRAIHKVRDIVAADEIVGIIGPMMSSGATVVAAWLAKSYPQIPMLTPTATDEGISSLGPNIFQLNVPNSFLARSIAEYAMRCLKASEFAILSPTSEYGRIMSKEFTDAVEAKGGKVLAIQQYQEGNTDFRTEFSRLRAGKLSLDNRRRNIIKGSESLDAFSPRDRKSYMDDSLISFDAVFIASSDAADAAAMASHAAFNKLGGVLLGSSGWYDRALLSDGKRLVEGAYFSAPFADVAGEEPYQRFAKAFAARWDNRQPDKERVSGLSYDAARVFFDAWLKSNGQNVPQAIVQQKTVNGVYGTYTFDSMGANNSVHVLTIQKNRFVLSDSCPAK